MSRPYSIPHIAPLYQALPYHYRNVRKVSVFGRCAPGALEKFLPSEFQLVGDVCEIFVMVAPDAGPLGHYTEAGVVIPVRYDGIVGAHVALEYVSSDDSLSAGREIWGYPKKIAEVDVRETANNAFAGTVVRRGHTLIDMTFTPGDGAFDKPQMQPRLQIKTFPAADGNGADYYQVIRNDLADLTVTDRVVGAADVKLKNGDNDPLADLGLIEITGAETTVTDFLLTTGKIIADLNGTS
ncbi:acetoacetate decarboxylase family protein [Pseudohoeflea coraliihabitans]|uniref:Acetoacetate decarboxylase family protein n=1 Tax=Pseudohoeflea coraliihabitans TaxID=2860393 RepID=A0ABS6WT99_9HYPH|nr:acetoacetate decarboxylase family protein [Pseudohoeflea sp. DP4N28-3]MBW3099182.1 acetoacetate decarboxylase family protein [Pseudohoeflea sp. DP4N28-3]